jgi:hypothetical protein
VQWNEEVEMERSWQVKKHALASIQQDAKAALTPGTLFTKDGWD